MLKQIGDFIRQIAFLTIDMQKSKADITQLQEQMQEVLEEIRQIEVDSQRDRENAAHEHEKLLLRLEVALLRSERRTLTGREDATLLLEDADEKR